MLVIIILRENIINQVSDELKELLKSNNIEAEITGREKTPFSIWRKIQSKRIYFISTFHIN